MEYKEFLAVLLVLGILGVEPAGAVEIGSLNQVNSPDKLNSGVITQNITKENAIVSQNQNSCLNKLKTHTLFTNHKKAFKLILNKVKGHKYYKLSRNSLTTTHNKGKISHSSSSKVSTKDSTKSAETSITSDKNIENNEINMGNATGANGTVLNQIHNETAFNQTVENETNVNGTILNNITDENKTNFNQTGNRTVTNETDINGTVLNNAKDVNETVSNQTDTSSQDSFTKTNVMNTLKDVGAICVAAAAICTAGAGLFGIGIALAPEGVTKTVCIVGAVVCGVAAGVCGIVSGCCYLADLIMGWFHW